MVMMDYLTPTAAARVLPTSADVIRRHCRDGTVPAVQVAGRWLLPPEAMQALRDRCPQGNPGEDGPESD